MLYLSSITLRFVLNLLLPKDYVNNELKYLTALTLPFINFVKKDDIYPVMPSSNIILDY